MRMRDLVAIFHEGHASGLSDEEIQAQIAKVVFEELKQMTEKEFISCFTSASFNIKTSDFEILLRLAPTTD